MRMKHPLRPVAGVLGGLTLGLALAPLVTRAQTDDMRNVSRTTVRDTHPDNSALSNSSDEKKEIDRVKSELDQLRTKMEAGQPAPIQQGSTAGGSAGAVTPRTSDSLGGPLSGESKARGSANAADPGPAVAYPVEAEGTPGVSSLVATPGPQTGSRKSAGNSAHRSFVGSQAQRGSPLQVFAVSNRETGTATPDGFTVLPTGAHVKARVVSGVEANAREPYPVLLQLDYSFTGPNKSRVDLSNCFMIAKAKANMSTERVMMETESLSCVREDGEHFKREAKGFVAGSDNTFGATGTYISKQGQVLLAAVLASIAKNAGQAIADAQKSTSIGGLERATTATNVTGNKAAYIGGAALVDGGAMVAQWYLEQAKELLPSIGVGSGQDVFVVMLDSIAVPALNDEE